MQKSPKMFKSSSITMNTKSSISLLIAIGTISVPTITRAQTYQPSNRIPVADNSLGTQVSGANNNFIITGGLNRGQNLFHSFQDFSVPTGGAATFLNPVGNRSIITRVTGGNFSDINGLVNTQGANFFLINPNGIVFGTNAQLNVGQTFVGSTANGIDLVDGGGRAVNFGTNQSGDAQLLTINPNALFNVSGLNMGGGNGQISNFGTLQTVNPSQYIGLFGGNVTLNGGKIIAPGGRVDLGGLTSVGTVKANDQGLIFNRNNLVLGNVAITNNSLIDITPILAPSQVITFSNDISSGGIKIDARELKITNSQISSNTFDNNTAGNIILTGRGDITIASSAISSNTFSEQGRAGQIVINTNGKLLLDRSSITSAASGNAILIDVLTLDMKNTSQIGSILLSNGNSGNINIKTNGDATIAGSSSIVSSNLLGNGNNGKISIDTKVHKLLLIDHASISNTLGLDLTGNSGGIDLNVGELEVRNSNITTDTILGQGNPGNITIITQGNVAISADSNQISRIASNSNGTAGNISIDSKILSINNGQITAIANSGQGGNITLKFSDKLILRTNSIVSTTSGTFSGGGQGGNIEITTPFIVSAPNENSDISANAFIGSGGKVNITTQQNFWISPLSRAELEKRLGTTDPNLLDSGLLSTNDITAISQVNPNLSGQVSITPPEIDITAGLTPLPNNITDPTDQINPNCSAKAIANNSFTSVGRGGIPATPKDPLNEQEIATNWVRFNPKDTLPSIPVATTPASSQLIVEAQGWRRERNGDIVLVAGSSLGTLPRQPQPQSGCVGQ
jgi:filamentous hemagglutinin family protein